MQINQIGQPGNRDIEEVQSAVAAIWAEAAGTTAAGVFQSKEEYTHVQGVSQSGTVDMSQATYGKPQRESAQGEKTVAETLQQDLGMSAEDRRNQMAVLANTLSEADLGQVQEEGYSISSMDSHQIITVVDKIKAALAKAGVDISAYGDALSKEQLEAITGSSALAAQISSSLAKYDLPLTQENIQESEEAFAQAASLKPLNGQAMRYMIQNHLTPSIENLYRAEHSQGDAWSSQTISTEQTGISTEDFEKLQSQIEQIFTRAGLPVNEDTLADSRWMLEQGLPLDEENINFLQQLRELSLQIGQGLENEDVLAAMATAITEGGRPSEGMLLQGYSLTDQAKDAAEVIDKVQDEDIIYVLSGNQSLTIANLKQAIAMRGQSGKQEQTIATDAQKQAALITARRQLEEVRLAMTTEANYALLKKGIALDTRPLEALVEDLKAQEEEFVRDMMGGKVVDIAEKTAQYTQTTTYLAEMKQYPAQLLSETGENATLTELHQAGASLQEHYEKAQESYEALMTAPRSDLGDNITKAFQNVDDILQDLGLEQSDANRRAVRILAYNQTKLTEENILQIKAKDEDVQRMFRNMTPQVVLEMIRRGDNPLDQTVQTLNQMAEEIQEELGNDTAEKFSKYLYKLEQNKEITANERESYVGVYRLFAQIEKTDGAVIGALVNQDAELTLRNLLMAVRSQNKDTMDYKIDDNFGGVRSKRQSAGIDEQIMAAYQSNLAKDVQDVLTPAAFSGMKDRNWEDMTPEQFKQELDQILAQEEENVQDAALDKEYRQESLNEFAKVLDASEDVYRYLEQGGFANSMQNILAAQRLLQNPGDMYHTLLQKSSTVSDRIEMVQDMEDLILERFGEAVKSPDEMAAAQEDLAELAENAMRGMILESDTISVRDLRELRLMNQQFFLCKEQAKEENYVVPMKTGDGVTGISLKIIRGKEKKGFVDLMFRGTLMGRVAASFEAKEDRISGVIATDDEETRKLLSENLGMLSSFLQEEDSEPVDVSVAYIPDLSLEHFSTQSDVRKSKVSTDAGETQNPVQTTRLYHIAESFLATLQELEGESIF